MQLRLRVILIYYEAMPPDLLQHKQQPMESIAALDLFRALPAHALEEVCCRMRVQRVAKDDVIFAQGGPAARAWAISTGCVRIVQTGSNGRQAILRFIGPGQMFGTVPLFTDHRLPADAIAAEASSVLSWSEADLLRLIDRHPRIAVNLIAVLGTRLGQLQERVRELTTLRAEQRLALAVLRLAAQAGRETASGRTIGLPLRRRDLAEFSGTTLYTASRALAAWQKAGLLASRRGQLTICDARGLRRIAGDG